MLNLRARPYAPSPWYILAFALGLLGLAIHVFLFWPGGVSVDTRSQFRQATTGLYDSWHPPSMAFLWRLLDTFVPGTLGMFTLQTLTLFLGLFLFWDIYRARSKAGACAVFLIPLTPMFVGISGMIWKDIQVAGFGLLAYGIFLSHYEGLFKARVVLGICIVLVCAFRHNGIFLVLPILIWYAAALTWRKIPALLKV